MKNRTILLDNIRIIVYNGFRVKEKLNFFSSNIRKFVERKWFDLIQLKEVLKEAGITQFDIAKELDIRSLSTVNLKLSNKTEFNVKEALLLRNLINKKTNKKYTIEELFSEQT